MTQAEYIAALRAKLAYVLEWENAAECNLLAGKPLMVDDIAALIAIEPDGRFEVNPIVRAGQKPVPPITVLRHPECDAFPFNGCAHPQLCKMNGSCRGEPCR